MIVENTHDEVLMAAVLGLQPEVEEIQRVAVPPTIDAADFARDLLAQSEAIVAAFRAGKHSEARALVATAQQNYRAAWPTPDQSDAPQPVDDTATSAVDLNALGARVLRS